MQHSAAHTMLFQHTARGVSRPGMQTGGCLCGSALGQLPTAPLCVAALHFLSISLHQVQAVHSNRYHATSCLHQLLACCLHVITINHHQITVLGIQALTLLRSAVVALCQLRWRLLLHDARPRGQVLPDGGPAVCGTTAGRLLQCVYRLAHCCLPAVDLMVSRTAQWIRHTAPVPCHALLTSEVHPCMPSRAAKAGSMTSCLPQHVVLRCTHLTGTWHPGSCHVPQGKSPAQPARSASGTPCKAAGHRTTHG